MSGAFLISKAFVHNYASKKAHRKAETAQDIGGPRDKI